VAEFELIYCNEPASATPRRRLALPASRERLVRLDFVTGAGRPIVEGL
jgi:hypothetical protein